MAGNEPSTELGRPGYHETLTRYYVTAVAQAIGSGVTNLDELFAHPWCSRTAALDYWSQDTLFSTEARLGWVPPDTQPTPWPIVTDLVNAE